MNNKLEIKITARNLVNAAVNLYADRCRAAIVQFSGLKVKCATGDWTAKFRKVIEALDLPSNSQTCGYTTTAWISGNGGYYITLNVKVYVFTGHSCAQAEESVSLANLQDGVIVRINSSPEDEPLRTNYSAAEIRAARIEVAQARNAMQAAERKLCHFGEYDHN
jgi:hypothetical protein